VVVHRASEKGVGAWPSIGDGIGEGGSSYMTSALKDLPGIPKYYTAVERRSAVHCIFHINVHQVASRQGRILGATRTR
jgi:hypothetical protein